MRTMPPAVLAVMPSAVSAPDARPDRESSASESASGPSNNMSGSGRLFRVCRSSGPSSRTNSYTWRMASPRPVRKTRRIRTTSSRPVTAPSHLSDRGVRSRTHRTSGQTDNANSSAKNVGMATALISRSNQTAAANATTPRAIESPFRGGPDEVCREGRSDAVSLPCAMVLECTCACPVPCRAGKPAGQARPIAAASCTPLLQHWRRIGSGQVA